MNGKIIHWVAFVVVVMTILFSSCAKEKNPLPTPLSAYNVNAYANGEFLTFNANWHGDSCFSMLSGWTTNISQHYDLDFYNIIIKKSFIGEYPLNLRSFAQFYSVEIPTSGGYVFYYSTDSTHTGSFSITAYDSINQTISGTFSFTGVGGNASGTPAGASYSPTISITNGVFTNVPY